MHKQSLWDRPLLIYTPSYLVKNREFKLVPSTRISDQENAFAIIKERLCSAPVLVIRVEGTNLNSLLFTK